MQPYRSRIPAAIDDLTATLKQRLELNPPERTVTVHDGPWAQGGTEHDRVIVAWGGFIPGYEYPSRSMSEQPGHAAVSSQSTQVGLGPGLMEQFSISCAAMSWTGSTGGEHDMSTARQRAYDLMTLTGTLVEPPWLNNTVMRAVFNRTGGLSQILQRRGLVMVVSFTIECTAMAQQL